MAASRRVCSAAHLGRPAAAPPARGRGAPRVRAQAEAAKPSKAADLVAEVERLKAENDALRAALAGYQQCGPAEVSLEAAPAEAPAEGAAAGAAGAAAAPAKLGRPTLKQLEAGIQWPSPEEGSFWERPPRAAPLPLAPPAGGPAGAPRDPRSMHVVHITAEMAPHAKVGGLGDVVTGLAKSCLARGHNVEIMLPVRLLHLFCLLLLPCAAAAAAAASVEIMLPVRALLHLLCLLCLLLLLLLLLAVLLRALPCYPDAALLLQLLLAPAAAAAAAGGAGGVGSGSGAATVVTLASALLLLQHNGNESQRPLSPLRCVPIFAVASAWLPLHLRCTSAPPWPQYYECLLPLQRHSTTVPRP